jgi:hypothetical protein
MSDNILTETRQQAGHLMAELTIWAFDNIEEKDLLRFVHSIWEVVYEKYAKKEIV